MLKELIHSGRAPTYRSYETGIEYDTFKGAFSWPKDGRHSYVCILGLETESKKLRLVADNETNSLTELGRLLKVLSVIHPPVRMWVAPLEGDDESYYEALHKICKKDGYSLACDHPSLADDLQLACHIIDDELRRNMLKLPDQGILTPTVPNVNALALTSKHKNLVTVLAQLIYEFPNVKKRVQKKHKKDAYDFSDHEEGGNWMSEL